MPGGCGMPRTATNSTRRRPRPTSATTPTRAIQPAALVVRRCRDQPGKRQDVTEPRHHHEVDDADAEHAAMRTAARRARARKRRERSGDCAATPTDRTISDERQAAPARPRRVFGRPCGPTASAGLAVGNRGRHQVVQRRAASRVPQARREAVTLLASIHDRLARFTG